MFNKTILFTLALLIATEDHFNYLNSAVAQEKQKSATQIQFEELVSQKDQDAIITLWQQNPGETAFIIDSYLEGGLALFERSGHEAKDEINAMYNTGLQGALAADKAFGCKIFTDYASSFIGWDDEQKKQFRSGQQAYGIAKEALKNRQFDFALTSATESIRLAKPLGDWWGVAVAQAVAGGAQKGLNNPQAALEAYSEARLLFQNFGMMDDLLNSEIEMSKLLVELKRFPRAQITINSAALLATQLEDTMSHQELEKLRSHIEAVN